MKKRYLALAGLLVLAVAVSGCGKDKEENTTDATQNVQTTPTPVPTVTQSGELVDMEVAEDRNVIGDKTASATRVVIVNGTGDDIGALYIRVHPGFDDEDEEWGDDLIDGLFVLGDGDEATYYFEPDTDSGATYDIRITYTEEGRNECFFRDIPLDTISQITLRLRGSGEDSVPYATYRTSTSSGEVSTLEDVLDRLGMSEEDFDSDEDEEDIDRDDTDEETEPTATPTPEPEDTQTPEPTATPGSGTEDPGNGSGTSSGQEDPMPVDDTITEAEGYIGQSFDELAGSLGEPMLNEYDDVPETGTTGYHYYPNFTVTTTVDEYGNETVSGIY